MKLNIGTAFQYLDLDSNKTLLEVPYQIVDDAGAILKEVRQSFPLEATQEEITASLTNALAVFKDEAAKSEQSIARQAALDNATKVAGTISGLSIQ